MGPHSTHTPYVFHNVQCSPFYFIELGHCSILWRGLHLLLKQLPISKVMVQLNEHKHAVQHKHVVNQEFRENVTISDNESLPPLNHGVSGLCTCNFSTSTILLGTRFLESWAAEAHVLPASSFCPASNWLRTKPLDQGRMIQHLD